MKTNDSHIKDYFRQELAAFKARPVLLVPRLCFIYLVLWAGTMQWIIMTFSQIFSIGFVFASEEEKLIPFTDEEIKQRKRTRVRMVWLRYLIVGLGSYVVMFFRTNFAGMPEAVMRRPYLYAAFFILQMVFVYHSLQEQVIDRTKDGRRNFLGRPARAYVFETIPYIMFFAYAYGLAKGMGSDSFATMGREWIHVLVLLIAALLLSIDCAYRYKNWKLLDHIPEVNPVELAKGGRA